jgi:hypothetical protein
LSIAAAIILGQGLRLAAPKIAALLGRIRLRFSLRTLLVVTLALGLALAWLGNKVRDVRQQSAHLDTAFNHGFGVSFHDSMPDWVYRWFGMNGALAWGDLETVSHNASLRDGDLPALHGLRFRAISLNGSPITDEQVESWQPPHELRCFSAQRTKLGDRTLRHISQFKSLESIEFAGALPTDAGIFHLVQLPNLYMLGLEKTPLTDDALLHLKQMKQLRYLRIWQTGITPQGFKELREALPDCVIVDDWRNATAENYYYWPERK